MRAALFTFSRGGCATARRILAALPEEAWMCYTCLLYTSDAADE